MALKNYTSEGRTTFDKIQRILTANGANKIMYEYDGVGRAVAIAFSIAINGIPVMFKMPANIEKVTHILYGGEDPWGKPKIPTANQHEQAYKTAWANIRDWIDVQMALVRTDQAELMQIFLPYATDKTGMTFYEKVKSKPQLLLE